MMKKCNYCNVCVESAVKICPLCRASLVTVFESDEASMYPIIIDKSSRLLHVRKILILLSVISCVSSVIINRYVNPAFWWSFIFIAAVFYAWIALSNLLRKNRNIAFKVVFQVLMSSFLLTFIDFQTGNHGWALSFAVPSIFSAGTLIIFIIIAINRTNKARYIFYQSIMALFGFFPILLYLLNLSKSPIISIISSVVSGITLAITIIFSDTTVKNEFKRRLHF